MPAKLPKRCVESVLEANIDRPTHRLGSRSTLIAGQSGIEAMALHPWGLAVVYKGQVVIVPHAAITHAVLAPEV